MLTIIISFKENKLFYLLISTIIISSFFLFSSSFYPLVNSDMAINVLIADSFSLPHDVYWWGQDRLGSFIPLISQPFIKLGMSPLLAVSICNYLVITLGFIGFSKLFKRKETIILFALVWFFPYQRFIDLNVFPLGLSYGLLGFSILFLRRIDLKASFVKNRKNLLNIVAIALIWFSAVWVSDLMYITLLTLGITCSLYFFFNKEFTENKKPIILTYVIIMVSIILVISKLKTYATGVSQKFASINTFSEIKEAFNMVIGGIHHLLDFRESFFVCAGAWVILFASILAIVLSIKHIRSILTFKNFWLNFFLADFLGVMIVIFLSHWVYLNQMGYWYFVAPYISGLLFILLTIDKSTILQSKAVFIGILVGALVISVSPITKIYSQLGEYRSTASYARELNKLGEIGLIGDFWEAYKLSIANPRQVKGTAHQDSDLKNNYERIHDVILQPKVFVSKEMWLESFPDTLNQFGYVLVKKGEPFFLAGSNLCEYKVFLWDEKTDFELNINNLTQSGGVVNNDGTVTFKSGDKRTSHSIYGPKYSLGIGKHTIEFYLSGLDVKNLQKELIADISYNFGQDIIIEKPLNKSNYNAEKGCFSFTFYVDRPILHTEFRILEMKSMDYTFHKIVVNKLNN